MVIDIGHMFKKQSMRYMPVNEDVPNMSKCLCGSEKAYEECCGIYHEGKFAPTPETLMRSRYTAYAMADMDYIVKTMKGKPLQNFEKESVRKWALSVVWRSLSVLKAFQENEKIGFVEFIAEYFEGDKIKVIHEVSEFHREDEIWYYVDGVHPKGSLSKSKNVSRNEPCPCGSERKFKNCHGRASS